MDCLITNNRGVSLPRHNSRKSIRSIGAVVFIGFLFACFGHLTRDGLSTTAFAATGREWYVSPTGSSVAGGSVEDPLDLATALSSRSPAGPGDVIWLRGGTYRGAFTSVLVGTTSAPIVVRQYPGERAIVDGNGAPSNTLTIRGAYTWYWGFEVMNSDPTRVYARRVNVDDAGSPDRVRGTGIFIYGPQTKVINMIVHDAMNGIFVAESAVDAEIYGVLAFHNGVIDTARGHGHGLYIQNRVGTKRIEDVISFGNHATGMKAYGEAGFAQGVHFEGVASFNNGVASLTGTPLDKMENLFVGTTDNPADRISVVSSAFYHVAQVLASNVTLGYQNLNNGSATIRDNLIMGGSVTLSTKHWRSLTATGNTIFATESNNQNSDQSLAQVRQPAGTAYLWDQNSYIDGTAKIFPFTFNTAVNRWGGGNLAIVDWRQATGFDSNSTYRTGRPGGVVVSVRPNRYELGRAHLIIYNWDLLSSVPVDVSAAGLSVGDRYEIRDAQGYFGGPIAVGTYSGAPVFIPMTGLTVNTPIGSVLFAPEHTAPEFGVFVIVKSSALAPQNAAPPSIYPAGGTFSGSVDVSLATSTLGASIRYTLDGSTPDPASPAYSTPVRMSASGVLKAQSYKSGFADSAVSQASFAIQAPIVVATPLMSPAGGSFSQFADVTLLVATAGATIQYSFADAAWKTYLGPIRLTAGGILRARAFKPGMTQSAVSAGAFTITTPALEPTTIGISLPLAWQRLTGQQIVRATVSGNVNISGVQFFVDGGAIGSEDTSAPYEVQWNTLGTSNGRHFLTAVARNGRERTSSSTTVVRVSNR